MNDVLALAVKYLTAQVLTYLALGMTFGLFCCAMWMGTVLSFAIAVTFGGVVFLPVLWRGERRAKNESPS
jgi:hypothetical protein